MKRLGFFTKFMIVAMLIVVNACVDQLEEMNQNPNGVDPATANPNMLLTTILSETAKSYLDLGYGNIGGAVQHTQKDGWWTGHNVYDWGPTNWMGWYGILRNNELMMKRADDIGFEFHKAIGLTMRAFVFANIADLWGDAPYTEALRGNADILYPQFDSQEVIYRGILDELKQASDIFAGGNVVGLTPANDIYFTGNIVKWRQFANSLALRYYMRLSEKLPDFARAGIESVYQSGVYIKSAADDATMAFQGNITADSWPSNVPQDGSGGSSFRRIKPCATLTDLMLGTDDPRTTVWFRPVHCQWVADETLPIAIDPYIRMNGEYIPLGDSYRVSYTDAEYLPLIAAGNVFTRHFNPTLKAADPAVADIPIDTREIVGVPPGLLTPDGFNFNPTVGQTIENQHVSQLSDMYRMPKGDMLLARLMSASEVYFILAEAAARGWSTGNAEDNYKSAIQLSLNTWGVGGSFADFIQRPGIAYEAGNAIPQIIQQKWLANWTSPEAWFDWRRTALPTLAAGPASIEPVVAIRFPYGENEINFNADNTTSAISRLQATNYGNLIGENNQWAKPWLLQGTGKPW